MDSIMKWLFSFVMIGVTLAWGIFSVNIVFDAASSTTIASTDVIAAAGVSGVMGALTTFDTLIVQYWFRKSKSTTSTTSSTTTETPSAKTTASTTTETKVEKEAETKKKEKSS